MRLGHRNPWTSPRADLAEARKLIETCGGELEDAEAALQLCRQPPSDNSAVTAGLSA